jgi:hypothetical protein
VRVSSIELRDALVAAEKALSDVYLSVRFDGSAKDAKESLTYARLLLEKEAPEGCEVPVALVEAKRLQMMIKRFTKEMQR